jgi:hypothetical protein
MTDEQDLRISQLENRVEDLSNRVHAIHGALSPVARARLERVFRKGRSHFIWVYGVLGWGVLTGVLFAIAQAVILGVPLERSGLSVGAFCAGGYGWGAWTWRGLRKRALAGGLPPELVDGRELVPALPEARVLSPQRPGQSK